MFFAMPTESSIVFSYSAKQHFAVMLIDGQPVKHTLIENVIESGEAPDDFRRFTTTFQRDTGMRQGEQEMWVSPCCSMVNLSLVNV